jgi:DNA polymerase (family 10)
MTNQQIAAMLFNIATLLDLAHDNLYRVRAYRRAARRILALREPATDILARGEPLPLPGVGERIRRKLAELISTGQLAFYEELLEEQPDHLRALLRVEGLGPILAERLYRDLGIASPAAILAAARDGAIRTVYGFGARRELTLAQAAATVVDRLAHVA